MTTFAAITTSWDDGHPLDFRLAELLAVHGLRGTFYIPRRAQTPTMSPAQVRELSRTFEIGAHTLNHVFLSACPDEHTWPEIRDSKAWVEDVTGRPCRLFCPPGGKFDAANLAMIEEAGYTALRTVELLSLDGPRSQGNLLLMPTTVQVHPHRWLAYGRNIARRRAWRNLWLYVRQGLPTDWANLSHSLAQECLHTGGVFHLWGHSWEIESNAQWGRLGEVLRSLSELARQIPSLTNGQLCTAADASQPAMRLAVS